MLSPRRRPGGGRSKLRGAGRINPRHPLARGLLNFTLLDGYTAIDLAAQQPPTIAGVQPGLTPFGAAGAYTGTTPKVQFPCQRSMAVPVTSTRVLGSSTATSRTFRKAGSRD